VPSINVYSFNDSKKFFEQACFELLVKMASIKITLINDDSEPRLTNRARRPSSTIPISNRRKSTARKPSSLLSPTLQMNSSNDNLSPQRRMSRIGRNHFLRSFGKDTLYGYEGVEGVLPEKTDDLGSKPTPNCQETIPEKEEKIDENEAMLSRLQRPATALSTSSNSAWLYKDILKVRGKEYNAENEEDISESIKEKIRSQSAKRRIRRIMLADKEKAETAAKMLDRKADQKKRRTFKGTTFSLLALKATTGTFDMFMEKKKWLTETRIRKKQIVSIVKLSCKIRGKIHPRIFLFYLFIDLFIFHFIP